jgi:hypothetical protein
MPANIAPAPSQVWPGIRIHAIAMVQPPGIGIAARDILAELSVSATAIANTTTAPAWID